MDPPDVLCVALAYACSDGVEFDAAWDEAVSRAVRACKAHERKPWRDEAFEATRDAWAAAYERLDASRCETAVTRLRDPDAEQLAVAV
jgi:hypothetical protein